MATTTQRRRRARKPRAPKLYYYEGLRFDPNWTIGWDLSTRRSAACILTDQDEILPLFLWTDAPRTKNLTALTEWFNVHPFEVLDKIAPTGQVVGLDWTPYEVMHRTRRDAAAVKSYLAGLTFQWLKDNFFYPVFIPPSQVRKHLGYPSNAAKAKIHEAFTRRTGVAINTVPDHMDDAVILAWIARELRSEFTGSLTQFSEQIIIYPRDAETEEAEIKAGARTRAPRKRKSPRVAKRT